jgi:ribose 5-phosphate isomerase B
VKRFEIVTEADARLLDPGSTIALAAGGHITPLAHDTLKSRRIAVVRDGPDPDLSALAPAARIARVAVAGDHTSLALKAAVLGHLRGRGVAAEDLGTHTTAMVDYPNTAALAARQVSSGDADAAIVIDGSGIGSSIAANKLAGVRAAMCPTPKLARYGREHNGINVLGLGSSTLSQDEALAIVDAFLDTPMREPRYIRRLALISELERRSR